MAISPELAYRLWAETYDHDLNPLLGLEHRILSEYLELRPGERVLDVATGTGRWLTHAVSKGAWSAGVDFSAEMLAVAATKPEARGRLIRGDVCALPFASDSVDVAVCSFALGYVASMASAFREMARVARRIVISDLHPDAVRAGWVRSFRARGQRYKIEHQGHSSTQIEAAAFAAGLRPIWKLDAWFEDQDRALFERAGALSKFLEARQVPAVLMSGWLRA